MSGDVADLVPDDFDLDEAVNAHSSTPPEKRKRCPDCRQTTLIRNNTRHPSGREAQAEYWCQDCCSPVEEPYYYADD